VEPESSFRGTMQIELSYHNRMRSRQEIDWSVCNLTENFLISVGLNELHLLARVSPVYIKPNPARFKK
jgi:hypothetical protein